MKYFGLFIGFMFNLYAGAVDNLNYIDFSFKEEGGNLVLSCQPSALISYEDIKDDRFGISKDLIELSLDSPMRQIAFMLRTLSNNRSVLMGSGQNSLDVLSVPFKLRVRRLDGEKLFEKEYVVTVGLSKEGAYLKYEQQEFVVNPERLSDPAEYDRFLRQFVFPFDTYVFPKPEQDSFVVDLHYKWPKLLLDEKDTPVFDLFPSLILWNKGPIRKIHMFLGSAYFWKDPQSVLRIASGTILKSYSLAHARFKEALSLASDEEPSLQQVALYEEVLHQFPMDRKVLERLMNAYLYHEMENEAAGLISGMQPIFSTIRKGLEHQADLSDRAERKRNHLLGRKQFFKLAQDAEIEILSPRENDLITGVSNLEFNIKGGSSPVLSAFCYFDDMLVGELQKEPWSIQFTAGNKRSVLPLKVMVYFENETFAEKQIEIRTMAVDQELSVHLVPLRLVVSKGGTGFMTGLKAEDFEIKENGVVQEIAHFSNENAPLRIAVLIDTSISMTGEKLDRAQYAVYQFISSLKKEDRVSLYTFDQNVLRLNDFSNDFDAMAPLIFNTCPQLSTSLYDACLAGIQTLEEQNGTRILLILSDGTDSNSISLGQHVVAALSQSDVMVYSVVLPGDWAGGSNEEGNMFLRDLAKMTGSVSNRLVRVNGVDEAMQKIAEEFRSFYYLGYYSSLSQGAKRDLEIDVKGFRAKVRYRVLQP